MKTYNNPKDVASFMQNAGGEVVIKKNDIYLDGIKVGEFHFPKNINKKPNEKHRITKIRIVGNKDFPCDIYVDNISVFRMRTAITFRTTSSYVKFIYYNGETEINELDN